LATFDGKPTPKPAVVAWYTAETFARFREIYADPTELPDSFEEWRRGAEQRLALFERAGIVPDKVIVDPEAVLAWARARGVQVNNQTRKQFVAQLIAPNDEHGAN
jgi:hypothetical protein